MVLSTERRPVSMNGHTPNFHAETLGRFQTHTVLFDKQSNGKKYLEASEALVASAATGDMEALGSMFDIYNKRLFRFCLNFGQAADAEDIAQNTWERVVRKMQEGKYFMIGIPFSHYLFTAAKHLGLDHLRRQQRDKNHMAYGSNFTGVISRDPFIQPEMVIEYLEACQLIHAEMSHLSKGQLNVLESRFEEELSVRETADKLGITENNVKVQQHKAIARIKKRVNGHSATE